MTNKSNNKNLEICLLYCFSRYTLKANEKKLAMEEIADPCYFVTVCNSEMQNHPHLMNGCEVCINF